MRDLIVDLDRKTIVNGTWEEIADLFEHLKEYNGDTQFSMLYQESDRNAPDDLPYSFTVRKIGPYYFPSKLDNSDTVWTYLNVNGVKEAGGKETVYGGDGDWDVLNMTLDYDLVYNMAKEFYETSDVKLLDF